MKGCAHLRSEPQFNHLTRHQKLIESKLFSNCFTNKEDSSQRDFRCNLFIPPMTRWGLLSFVFRCKWFLLFTQRFRVVVVFQACGGDLHRRWGLWGAEWAAGSTARWSLSSSPRPTPTCCFCGSFSHKLRSGTSSCRQTSWTWKQVIISVSTVVTIEAQAWSWKRMPVSAAVFLEHKCEKIWVAWQQRIQLMSHLLGATQSPLQSALRPLW